MQGGGSLIYENKLVNGLPWLWGEDNLNNNKRENMKKKKRKRKKTSKGGKNREEEAERKTRRRRRRKRERRAKLAMFEGGLGENTLRCSDGRILTGFIIIHNHILQYCILIRVVTREKRKSRNCCATAKMWCVRKLQWISVHYEY